jgi:hypothetical protein
MLAEFLQKEYLLSLPIVPGQTLPAFECVVLGPEQGHLLVDPGEGGSLVLAHAGVDLQGDQLLDLGVLVLDDPLQAQNLLVVLPGRAHDVLRPALGTHLFVVGALEVLEDSEELVALLH